MMDRQAHQPIGRGPSSPARKLGNWPAITAICGLGLLTVVLGSPAWAAAAVPSWNITASASPTNLLPGGIGIEGHREANENKIELTARNLGSTTISGATSPIVVAVNLQGASVASIQGEVDEVAADGHSRALESGQELSCTQPAGPCTYSGTVGPGQVINVFAVVSTGAPGTITDAASVSGGTASRGDALAPASVEQQVTVSSTPASFGIQPSSLVAEFSDAEGNPVTQAGAHPYDLNVSMTFNSHVSPYDGEESVSPIEDVKDLIVELPPGVAGNEMALDQCATSTLVNGGCSGSSQVGTVHIGVSGGVSFNAPWGLFNLQPDNGNTNELGFDASGEFPVNLISSVRTSSDYGITSTTPKIPNFAGSLLGLTSRVWGVPAEPSHDFQRVLKGWNAGPNGTSSSNEGGHPSPLQPTPFFTMPSQCGTPLVFHIVVDSYQRPGAIDPLTGEPELSDPNWKQYTVTGPPLTGCERLQSFSPDLTVAPDTTTADTPAGVTVELNMPQGEGLSAANTLATPTLQDTKVALPPGLVISPGQANGLGACQPSEDGVGTDGPPSCPADSKVGTAEISTPLLPDKLEGTVYLLQSSPPNLQIVLAASADDVNLKLIGNVSLNPQTGQVTATFSGTPELPFTHFKLTFSGGAQAALMTPPSCGVYSSLSDFTPWSSPGTPDFLSSNAFGIDSGPAGSPCQSPLPFAPSLIAGSTTDQAGGYTDFSLLLSRGDGQQRIGALQFKTPAGLLGMLSKVPLCPEPQAAAGTCSAESQIGHTVVGAGAGPDPLYIPEAGQAPAPIYLTGPYKGAPFGLSIVVPVIAGPFNLGTVVVRATISVDPATTQLTIATDPLPQILDGIPTDLRQIDAVINRAGFMFNPTNCSPQSFSGTATSAEGATAPISSHFQMGSCQSLKFAPDFKVATRAQTSKADGASLEAKIVYPTTPLGANQASSQANIKAVKVDLPKQLPSRLTTLQKACLAKVFEANPANCQADSVVGHATAVTPVLPVPLNGPAYFVSHGGEAFPSLIVVLQGYGVTVDLVGTTFISKAGITSSTFKQVPDVPISSFTLTLPTGPFSALAANLPAKDHGNFCGTKLAMPTAFVGQNGAEIHDTTAISVSGCAKAKALTRAQKLTKALKACKQKAKGKRSGCEKTARKDYGPVKKASKKKKS